MFCNNYCDFCYRKTIINAMDLSKVLLLLLDFFFFLMLLFLLLGIGFFAYVSFVDDMPLFIITENGAEDFDYMALIRLLAEVTSYITFVAIVYFLRKGVRIMVKHHIFNFDVAKCFNISGLLLTLMSITTLIFNFSKDLYDGLFKINLDLFDWKSGIFLVIVGLFLMLMSRVIKAGLELKSENELTI